MRFRYVLYVLFVFIMLRCARIGQPTGGEKDITPPKLLKSIPDSAQTGFDQNTIKLYFDEYVVIKNPQKNILISPPPEEMPQITPAGFASKVFEIKFDKALQKNTTYLINFGESIADYNEGNKLNNLQLVFSTGSFIDTLQLEGKIIPVYMDKKPEKILVGLYPLHDFNDSVIFKHKPYYVTVADKQGNFKLKHLKAGSYKIIALGDQNGDYKYKQDDESIGFVNHSIEIPKDTPVQLYLFKEFGRFEIKDILQKSKNHIVIDIKGDKDSLVVTPLMALSKSFGYFEDHKYHFWYQSVADSIKFQIKLGNKQKIYRRKRIEKSDSLILQIFRQKLAPIDSLIITANMPLMYCDASFVRLKKDSLPVDFKCITTSEHRVFMDFDKEPGAIYHLQIFPNAVTGFNGSKNKDTIQSTIMINKNEAYGNLHLQLDGKLPTTPVFVELLQKNRVVRKSPASTDGKFDFLYVTPGKYTIRFILDSNRNNRWDTGNYLNHRQPEKTYEPHIEIEVRANWDLNQTLEWKNR